MDDYSKKFKDPRWQKKRLEIFERDYFTCQSCESTEKTLNVHHKYYIKNRDPWDYPDDLLITLCEDCHEYEQGFISDILYDFAKIFLTKYLPSELWYIMHKFQAGHIDFENPKKILPSIKEALNKDPIPFKKYLDQSLQEAKKRMEERKRKTKERWNK